MSNAAGHPSAPLVTRFAPSPTGWLHLGHAYAALFASDRARGDGGRFLLRLEDIDRTRCRPAFAAGIIEDLTWLGVTWDGPVRVQSAHLHEYRGMLDTLRAQGLVYPCFCTRAGITREIEQAASAPHGPDGAPLYPGTCRALTEAERSDRVAAGLPYALRLDMEGALARIDRPLTYFEEGEGCVPCHPGRFGDVVLARKDIFASYHACVTHDDALQRVTLVTRGSDLRAATDLHRLLQTLMGWPEPRYAHHRLVTDESGRRLAKRGGGVALRQLREHGAGPSDIRQLVGLPLRSS